MIVEIIPAGGGQPIRIHASQLAVFGPTHGVPLMVAGEYGPDGIKVSHAADKDFNSTLRAFGYNKTVVIDALELDPPPRGGKLLAGTGHG